MRPRRLTALFALAALAAAAQASPGEASAGRFAGNLLLNPAANVGGYSVQGWDSVTIPGWQVLRGLPTVIRSGTRGFPRAGAAGGRLFAGGPGGTAILAQRVSLRSPAGTLPAGGTHYRLTAWLGGTATSSASVTVMFMSAAGRGLGHVTIGPVGHTSKPVIGRRSVSAVLRRGAASAEIVVSLATTLRSFDGPNAPIVGYNRAVAGQLSFTVAAHAHTPPLLTPPVAHVPRFDHVFMFTFENQDLRTVIGNRRQAPYLNSLLPMGSLMTNLFAEEHPSDGNYLALAAGGVFGIPLTDPLELNPRFTINVRHIGDLLDAAHEPWKAYMQGANGPCDDTVHRYYWNDDLPFLYFPDVRDNPSYCSAHVVPLEAMNGDLASAATTPSFAWIGPDDCTDMEGCGIRTGDSFLARTLGSILSSPAWRTQRSLAIITFDEDGYDHEHPPQLVPTIVLASTGVRAGYVSRIRYTHYSLLRTIEAALGLGTLTQNDRYAQPLNDVFGPRPSATAARSQHHGPRHSATAFVVNSASANVTPVLLATGKTGKAIRVGSDPTAIALTPNGNTAYVVNSGSDSVTPIDTHTRRAGGAIPVGSNPRAIALTPDGRTAYVANSGSDTVTPIATATGHAAQPIAVGSDPRAIAVTPDGKTAYVLDWGGASVTPVDLATNTPRPAIPVGSYPDAIAISPNGAAAYVANYGSDTVTPIVTSSNQAAPPVPAGQAPDALALTPDGRTLEVVSGDLDSVTPIDTSTLRAGSSIRVGYSPAALAMSSDGATAWVVNTISGTLTPIATSRSKAGRPVSVGLYAYPTAIAFAPRSSTAVVVDTYGGQVSLVNTRTRHARAPITVGSYPVAVAIAR